MNRRLITHALFVLFLFCGSLQLDASEIRLEGVAYDTNNPASSVAVINGDFYGVGSQVQRFKITEINENTVHLKSMESGKELILGVEAKPETQKERERKESDAKAEAAANPPKNVLERTMNAIKSMTNSPSGVKGRAWEFMALRELAGLNNASVKYYNFHEFFPRNIKSLTLDGWIDESYAEGIKGKYKFYFDNDPNPDHLGIHADPIEEGSKMRSFFVGADAEIREEAGKPATLTSPKHDLF